MIVKTFWQLIFLFFLAASPSQVFAVEIDQLYRSASFLGRGQAGLADPHAEDAGPEGTFVYRLQPQGILTRIPAVRFPVTRTTTLEQQIRHFVETAVMQNRGDLNLSVTEIRNLCVELATTAHRHLIAHKVESIFDENQTHVSIKILPTGASSLNQLAKRIAGFGEVSVEYDLTFLFSHPYAAASFVRATQEMVLSHSSIADLNAQAVEINHELVHVEIWQKLKSHETSPFYGSLEGEAFEPDVLNLDEMAAYDRDFDDALRRVDEFLSSSPNPSSAIGTARMKEILVDRLAGHPPLTNLTTFEALWDNAAKKIIHGMWHTQPAADALAVVEDSLNAGEVATFTDHEGNVRGALTAMINQKKFTAHIDLVMSQSPSDTSNGQQFKTQVAWSRATANERLIFWDKAANELLAVVNSGSTEEQLVAAKQLHSNLYPSRRWARGLRFD